MPYPGRWDASQEVEARFGTLRANDQLMVCYRCGCAFLPMVIEDPRDDLAQTECPVCDHPRTTKEGRP